MSIPIPGMQPGESLDQFHDRCVVPSQGEINAKLAAIGEFVPYLQGKFSKHDHTIARIYKSGSLGKGTPVRGKADIDLVVHFNGLKKLNDLKSERPRLLADLKQKIAESEQWKDKVQFRGETPYSLQYTFDGEPMDVLPAFEIDKVVAGGLKTIYANMSSSPSAVCRASGANNYSASLAHLQIEFVKSQSEGVKRGIRVLKAWKEHNSVDIRSYTMELLAINAARTGHGGSTKDIFQHVLTQLTNPKKLKVAFNDFYDSAKYVSTKRPPFVMDPVSPYMDTMKGKDAAAISKAAQEALALL